MGIDRDTDKNGCIALLWNLFRLSASVTYGHKLQRRAIKTN